MKVKKLLSAVLSAAICCSFLPANISADKFEMPISTDSYVSLMNETVNGNNSVVSALSDSNQLGDIELIPTQLNGISTYNNSGISAYSNPEFVMGLQLSAANPESVINGSPTTDTILYWFWSDGEEQYTYDPAGYDIVQYYVLGIEDNMLGMISIDDTVVGFATQFTEAGPQDFQYYAENSNGDVYGIRCSIDIEPADGSKRPIGYLQISKGPYYENSNIVFDWSNSYDEDSGDTIADARIRVYNGDNYELATEDSQYFVSKSDNRVTLKFANAGTYKIMLSVSDNHNNWSNWVGGSITVYEDTVQILTLADKEWRDSKYERWKPSFSNTYNYRTLYSTLSGEICVVSSEAIKISRYTNHKGTYYNVYMAPIAEGTVFSCADVWSDVVGNPDDRTDPVFGLDTPRKITQDEIQYLKNNGYHYYIIYTKDYKVVDFYSELNPLIKYGWSNISISQ